VHVVRARQSPSKLLCRLRHGLTLEPARPQLDVRLAARDARWHCERWYSLSLLGGAADVFFIDTSPGVAEYQAAPWAGNPGATRATEPIVAGLGTGHCTVYFQCGLNRINHSLTSM